jgi:3-methyladenine DNA glycosylase AlkD
VTDADAVLLAAIRADLAAAADPVRAAGQQAYMKSAMPYYGVPMPKVRSIVRDHGNDRPFATADAVTATVRALWDPAAFREERYAAILLADTRAARRLSSPAGLGLYRHLVVTGAWWDLVDPVAGQVGALLRTWPGEVEPVLRTWMLEPDLWLRRVAIIGQLGAKEATDVALLSDAILANTADRDFFIRKAIGWALRDYARTAPDWVSGFVAAHRDELSGLSVREATKHLKPEASPPAS